MFAADFKAYFQQFGRVAEVQILQDYTSGRSRGFGRAICCWPAASCCTQLDQGCLLARRFVTFDDDSAVDHVFAAGLMHEISGKKVPAGAART